MNVGLNLCGLSLFSTCYCDVYLLEVQLKFCHCVSFRCELSLLVLQCLCFRTLLLKLQVIVLCWFSGMLKWWRNFRVIKWDFCDYVS